MTMIAPQAREPVGATPRARMTPARRRAVLERQGPLCAIQGCGKAIAEIDHQIPLAMGGSDGLDNLAGLCSLHHLAKTAVDFAQIAKAKRLGRKALPRIVSRLDIMGGEPCIEGTRIPPRAIKSFHEAGYSIPEIIAEYPDLSEAQVQAALDWKPVRMLRGRGFPKSSAKPKEGSSPG